MNFDARAIESYRMCLTHDPQSQLGQFNWPLVLGLALDEIERLRSDLRAAQTTLDEAFQEAEQDTAELRAALDRVLALCDEPIMRRHDASGEMCMDLGFVGAVRAAVAGDGS